MALNFLKNAATPKKEVEEQPKPSTLKKTGLKLGSKPAPEPEEVEQPKKKMLLGSAKTEAKSSSALKSPSGGVSFLKKGADAQAAWTAEQAKIEANKEKQGRMFQFRMQEGEERQITFLDGDLGEDGLLEMVMYHEHTIQIAGGYESFVCTAETDTSQPCPLCETGSKRYLVGLLTIIDHTAYTIQKGKNQGKTVQHQRKLFKAKQGTIKTLSKYATKTGGLTGWSFDVSRSGNDKSPNVGDVFMPLQEWESREQFAEDYELAEEDVQPAAYEEEIFYKSPEELLEMGIGKSFTGVGTKKGGKVNTGALAKKL